MRHEPEHGPARYYNECTMHFFPTEHPSYVAALEDTEDQAFSDYENWYWDEHFYLEEASAYTCEENFVGLYCPDCEENWPCSEAVLCDRVLERDTGFMTRSIVPTLPQMIQTLATQERISASLTQPTRQGEV